MPGREPRNTSTMTLADHLREVRRRAVRSGLAVLVGVVVGYLVSDQILDVLRAPIEALAESRNASLNFDSVSAAFDLKMRIAFFAGLALASPVWLHQLFGFFLPGLTRRERRFTLGFLAAALPLFIAGCLTGLALFPHVVELLAGFTPADDSTVLVASYYVDFVMKLVLAVGVAFVLPVFVVLLNFAGVLPGASVVRSWRVVVIGIVLFSALATPSADLMSMFLLAVPMCALFAAAALIAVLHDRAVARRNAAAALVNDPPAPIPTAVSDDLVAAH
ncbi:twin-arginine translocase subunit TatC [Herbiconiux sp. CPCC 205716]|uniref:Sec-independent protein translocase protein TatC n=1 Tax=Herbiconiux gentiana TaxID=2970912 RepID=A0ABT2GBQ8_9MICO|nr:twin-arginine translocase subunit TatC [Herbiconiux gentiana]MCS5713556.1 twin-arginine translocase subunit TatC [Herbiconiux gentiana]